MIRLTRLNHVPLVLNADLIEHVEVTPDTVISLTNGQKLIVLESAEEVINRVIAYRRAIQACPWRAAGAAAGERVPEESESEEAGYGRRDENA
jgi:flagellar protein FlbD